MGFITNKYVKDKNKKFWIQTAIDVILIMMLLVVGMSAKAEFENGARFMLQNVPSFCVNQTLYAETLEYYGLETAYDSRMSVNISDLGGFSP